MHNRFRKTSMLVVAVIGFLVRGVSADTLGDLNTALDSLSGDLALVSGWVNDQVSKSAAFSAGGTVIRPGAVKTLPGFELGFESGIAAALDKNNLLANLDLYSVSSDLLRLPPFFFLPNGMIHAKVGLLSLPVVGKLDVGAGFLDFEVPLINDLYGRFTQWQLEARIQPDLPLPFDLSFNLGIGHAQGNYTVQRHHQEEVGEIYYNQVRYAQTLDSVVYLSSDWDITSYYLKMMISKTLLFVTPYVGAGIQTNLGKINTVTGALGTISLDPALPGPPVSQTLSVAGPVSASPRNFDYRLIAGLQFAFLPFLNVNLAAESGQNVYSGSVGLILSFL